MNNVTESSMQCNGLKDSLAPLKMERHQLYTLDKRNNSSIEVG